MAALPRPFERDQFAARIGLVEERARHLPPENYQQPGRSQSHGCGHPPPREPNAAAYGKPCCSNCGSAISSTGTISTPAAAISQPRQLTTIANTRPVR